MSVTERERERRLWKLQGNKAYEDKEEGSEGVVKHAVTASWGVRRERGQKRTRKETEWWSDGEECSVWTFMCVCLCVLKEGGLWMAVRGMCSLSQESPGAKAERSTSLPREGVTGQPRLFLPAPPSMHGKRTEAFNVPFATNENQNFPCNFKRFHAIDPQSSFKSSWPQLV